MMNEKEIIDDDDERRVKRNCEEMQKMIDIARRRAKIERIMNAEILRIRLKYEDILKELEIG